MEGVKDWVKANIPREDRSSQEEGRGRREKKQEEDYEDPRFVSTCTFPSRCRTTDNNKKEIKRKKHCQRMRWIADLVR